MDKILVFDVCPKVGFVFFNDVITPIKKFIRCKPEILPKEPNRTYNDINENFSIVDTGNKINLIILPNIINSGKNYTLPLISKQSAKSLSAYIAEVTGKEVETFYKYFDNINNCYLTE